MLIKSNTNSIPYFRRRHSSTQVGMEFYRQCSSLNLTLVTEYSIDNCRFDAVLVKDSRIILIIEFKSSKRNVDRTRSKQCSKYLSYGVDVLYVTHIDEVHRASLIALEYWNKF